MIEVYLKGWYGTYQRYGFDWKMDQEFVYDSDDISFYCLGEPSYFPAIVEHLLNDLIILNEEKPQQLARA